MATRRQVREAFYAELETAVDGLVDPTNVTQEGPDGEEDLPAVTHGYQTRDAPLNRETAPIRSSTQNGETTYTYVKNIQILFSVTVQSDDAQLEEDIYEAVRTYFEKYDTPVADVTTIQSDVHDIDVTDATTDNDTERGPPLRADRIDIELTYQRFYEDTGDNLTEVDARFDQDNDGQTDEQRTYDIQI